jgi:hypothetical protein
MPRTVKRLAQSALSTTATARYTASTSPATTAQVTEIYLVNNGASDRTVDIYQGGTAATNRIMRGVSVPAGGSTILQDLKIVVASGQTLAANQDAGTDIIMTAFGIEEV